jgi:hypothetical protein
MLACVQRQLTKKVSLLLKNLRTVAYRVGYSVDSLRQNFFWGSKGFIEIYYFGAMLGRESADLS